MNEAVLGVDYGSVRIGVAICEAPGLPAVPLTTIAHESWSADIAAVAALARERAAGRIVVGNPIRLDGAAGRQALKVGAFVGELQAAFDGEVIAQDERLTTAAAAKKLRELPVSGSTRRRHIDELAAVEILNSYLARRGAS
jgi:putative holliday junction resolvase